MLTKTEMNDANLNKAINMNVIPVATYVVNICKLTAAELKGLDQIIKKEMHLLGRQTSDEQYYIKREEGGWELKSMRDAYKERD